MRLARPAAVIAACAAGAVAEAPFSSLPIEPPGAAQPLNSLPIQRRRLSQVGSNFACQLNNFPTDVVMDFNECVAHLEQTADFHVAGAEIAIQAECWCRHNVSEVYENLGCCDDPRLWQWCRIDCSPDCASDAAQKCTDACPAICLEEHYAIPTCSESCAAHDCHEQMLCITEHAKNWTNLGLLDHVCHDVDWQQSQHVQDYQECVAGVPQRTYWNWRNAINHCICKTDVKNATEEHHCCKALWAGDLCNASFCPDLGMCDSDEALDCAETCNDICQNIKAPSSECSQKCLDDDGECSQYLFCPPPPAKPFDYLCASGSAPDSGGCCVEPHSSQSTCPFLCDSGTKLLLSHGAECVCQNCPTTQAEQLEKFKVEVTEGGRYLAGGEAYLAEIVARVGLDAPTSLMLSLLEQRNADMVEVFELYASNYADLLAHLEKVHYEYIPQIEEAAWRCKNDDDCEENGDSTGRGKGGVVAVAVACVGVLVFCCCAACLAFMYQAKRRSSHGVGNPPELSSSDPHQDDNVVIGSPVDDRPGGSAAAGAAMGLPPAGAPQAAKDPDAENNNAGVVAVGHPVPGHSPDAEKAAP